MITFFTIPKSFKDKHIKIIQTNAILSWKNLDANNEILIYGNEYGISDFSKNNNIYNINDIKINEFGTPILSSIFSDAINRAKNNIIIYCNSDIIFTNNLIKSINFMIKNKFYRNEFLICGRRIDYDINTLINFNDKNWENNVNNDVNLNGNLHGFSGIDYFIFKKSLSIKLLDFAVGRIGWDNWLLYNLIKRGVKIIDASKSIIAIHQNHNSAYSINSKESINNLNIVKGMHQFANIYSANYLLSKNLISRPPLIRRIIGLIKLNFPFNYILSLKRYLFNRFSNFF